MHTYVKIPSNKMCRVTAEFLESVYMNALTFINIFYKPITSGKLNIPQNCNTIMLSSSWKSKDGRLLFSEIGRGSFSNLKFEEVLKIQTLVLKIKKKSYYKLTQISMLLKT